MSTNEQALADRLKADAMAIFNDPPSMTSQEVRDVIEWYDESLRVALTAEQPQSDVQRDAERLTKLRDILQWDGHGYWLPDLCIKERGWGEEFTPTPTLEELRAAIDAAIKERK